MRWWKSPPTGAPPGAARSLGRGLDSRPGRRPRPPNLAEAPAVRSQGRPRPVRELLRSHYDNNYTGAVKRLGAIPAEFAGLDPATMPCYRVNGLKREELIAWNSMILHEMASCRPQAGGAPSVTGPGGRAGRQHRPLGPRSSLAWARRWAAARAGCCSPWSRRARAAGQHLGVGPHPDHGGRRASAGLGHALEHAYQMDYGAKAGRAWVGGLHEGFFSWRNANEASPPGEALRRGRGRSPWGCL